MTGRPDRDHLAAEFLRKGLANGPVLVSELEAAAGAAGLLGSDQRISDAKRFKRVKKFLGIRSVRNGFGSAGEWFWLLEKQPTPLVAEPPPEVAPRIPSGWIDGVGRLSQRRPPPDIPPHRWRQFLTDCTKFLASLRSGQSAPPHWVGTPWPCSAAAAIVLSTVPAVPVCCGPSMAAGWSSFIATGPLLSWRRMGRGAFLSVGVLMPRMSGCPGSEPEAT
jgi:hypothetical protein